MPLVEVGQESGVGRWHTIRLTALSFYEHLQIKHLWLPELDPAATQIMRIPAPLLCYWMDVTELPTDAE